MPKYVVYFLKLEVNCKLRFIENYFGFSEYLTAFDDFENLVLQHLISE